MSLIHIANLTFCYEGSYDNIFEDVSFQIDTDWRLGFTGRNGRGKTTFMQLLMGKYPYAGKISASVQFEYFPFAVTDKTANTVDIIESICSNYELWRLCKELSLLDVAEDVLYRPFQTLSNGEQTKVLLAALFLKENHFLLIDEPTNHLDREGREILGRYLRGKSGFILISHDRVFLDSSIDHILSINKTNIEVQKGNYSSWQHNKQMQDAFEQLENEKLKKDIKRLSEAAKQTANWSDSVEKTKIGTKNSGIKPDKGWIGHKAAKMMKRSMVTQSRQEKAIEQKETLLKNTESAENLALHPLKFHSDRLMEAIDLAIVYDARTVCQGVSFTVNRGERIALVGRNGSGKSSILKLLLGEEIPYTGKILKANGIKISYICQDTGHLTGSLEQFVEEQAIDESLFKAILRKLDFSRVQFEKNMEDFSAGQKKKVLIAKSLCQQAHLYIWDEPLNYIDVISRIQIEEMLLAHPATMIFVEHDLAFARAISSKQITM